VLPISRVDAHLKTSFRTRARLDASGGAGRRPALRGQDRPQALARTVEQESERQPTRALLTVRD
jgi:hypothetical protein